MKYYSGVHDSTFLCERGLDGALGLSMFLALLAKDPFLFMSCVQRSSQSGLEAALRLTRFSHVACPRCSYVLVCCACFQRSPRPGMTNCRSNGSRYQWLNLQFLSFDWR